MQARGVQRTDFGNLTSNQARPSVPFATRPMLWVSAAVVLIALLYALLVGGVTHVVSLGSKEKVAWIATDRIVAGVAGVKAVWPFSCCNEASNDVSAVITVIKADFAVTFTVLTCLPRPAFVRFALLDFGPKASDSFCGDNGSNRLVGSHDAGHLRVVVRADQRVTTVGRLASL